MHVGSGAEQVSVLSVQTRAFPAPLPSPGIAELINVMSERAHLKERVRDDGQHREDKCEHNDCEEYVHRPPFADCHSHEWKGHRHRWFRGSGRPKLLIARRVVIKERSQERVGRDDRARHH